MSKIYFQLLINNSVYWMEAGVLEVLENLAITIENSEK
jgi:hypothetical protein